MLSQKNAVNTVQLIDECTIDSIIEEDSTQLLQAALAKLTVKEQIVFDNFCQGLSFRASAQKLKVSSQRVQQLFHHSMIKLRTSLAGMSLMDQELEDLHLDLKRINEQLARSLARRQELENEIKNLRRQEKELLLVARAKRQQAAKLNKKHL